MSSAERNNVLNSCFVVAQGQFAGTFLFLTLCALHRFLQQ